MQSSKNLPERGTADSEDRAVTALLNLLYKDFSTSRRSASTAEQWASHNNRLEQIAEKHIVLIEEFIQERYRCFLSKTDKSALFQNFVISRTTLTMNFIKGRVMRKLADYQRVQPATGQAMGHASCSVFNVSGDSLQRAE